MIPQNNPLANYLALRSDIDDAIKRVLERGQYCMGDETLAFEQEFAQYVGVAYAIGVGSGTDALQISLRAAGIGPGDEVITVSHTSVATVAAIEICGAKPVLIDIEPRSYTLDPTTIETRTNGKTRAVIPVHPYGHPANLGPLLEHARRNNLYVIEDCAQAHGAVYHDRKLGAWGDAGAFSFYPTKNLGCLGDGGAVTTGSPELYEKLLAIRQYGWDEQRVSQMPGLNSRLDEIQAAVLRVKLRHLDQNNRKRRKIADTYKAELDIPELTLPGEASHTTHVYHQYVVRCVSRSVRDGLMEFLRQEGIQCAIHYPVPVHMQPAYIKRLHGCPRLPITEEVAETIVSLPMFPELSVEDTKRISQKVREFYEHLQP
jgi:dTDP-4-amino-4,6-dideoxygalactose transaminase